MSTRNQSATITIREIVAEFNLEYATVYAWVRRRKIVPIRNERNEYIFNRSVVKHFIKERDRKRPGAGLPKLLKREPGQHTLRVMSAIVNVKLGTLRAWAHRGWIKAIGILEHEHEFLFSVEDVRRAIDQHPSRRRRPPDAPATIPVLEPTAMDLRVSPPESAEVAEACSPSGEQMRVVRYATVPDRFEHDYLPEKQWRL